MSEPPLAMQLCDEAMPADISQRTRKVIDAVMAVQQLEQQLPLLDNISQIEELRTNTMVVADWAKRHTDPLGINGPRTELYDWKASVLELYNWAVRVGMMCQRRVGQLLGEYKNRGGRPPKKTSHLGREVSEPPPKPSLKDTGFTNQYISNSKVLAATPTEELNGELDAQIKEKGVISKSEVFRKLRQKKKEKDESPKAKTETKEETPQYKRNSPADKFRRYWFKEKKLLLGSFETAELELVGEYWWREFNNFRANEEKILADSRQERARRKALAQLAKP